MQRRVASGAIPKRQLAMTTETTLMLFLVMLLTGVIPGWHREGGWGFGPGKGLGILATILSVFLFLGWT